MNTNFQNIQRILHQLKKHPLIKNKNFLYVLGFVATGLFLFLAKAPSSTPLAAAPDSVSAPEASVDTFIPAGYVLIPLELSNAEALSGLINEVGGVIDLYLTSLEEKHRGIKVGQRLKLLRAPLNPNQYAVLVPEGESDKILKYAGPFTAVVQNPAQRGTQLTEHSPSKKVKIHYQN